MSEKFTAIYGRVSDVDEESTSSVPQQLRDAKTFVRKKWANEQVREFHEVVSARDIKGRPIFCELLALCKGGQVNRIIIRDQDRLSRGDASETLQCLAYLKAHDVEVWEYRSGHQICCDSPHAKLMTTVMAGVAAFEREITTLRVTDKMRAMRRDGKWTGGHCPLGYSVGVVDGKKTLVPNEKAAAVRRVFATAVETRSLAQTYRLSAALGLWKAKQSIQHILVNRVFLGEWHTAEGNWIKGHHEPIVDEKTFALAQTTKELGFNPRERKVIDRIFTLQGLVMCAHCGRRMTPYHTKKESGQIFYYECGGSTKKSCPVKRLPAQEFEHWAWQELSKLCQDPNVLYSALAEHQRSFNDKNSDAIIHLNDVRERLKAAETKRDGLMAYADGLFGRGQKPADSLNDRLSKLDAEIATLKAEVAVAQEKANPPQKIDAEGFLIALRRVLVDGSPSPTKKKAVFQALMKRIVISRDKIEIDLLDPSADLTLLAEGTMGTWFEDPSMLAEREGFV